MSNSLSLAIYIINYNQSDYLEESVVAALQQTGTGIDITLVDNCSSDKAERTKAKEIAGRHGVRFLQRGDRNLAKCLNAMLEDARSHEFIAFVAADDIYIHYKSTKQVEYLRRAPESVAGCFGSMIRINSHGGLVGINPVPKRHTYCFNDIFTKRVDLYSPTAVYRIAALNQVGGFDENHAIEDLSIYLKLTNQGYKLETIGFPLCLYRIHDRNTHTRFKWMMEQKLKIWSEYQDEPFYKKGINNIYLEHFSNFGSSNKKEFLKTLRHVWWCVTSKYFWVGWARFLCDW